MLSKSKNMVHNMYSFIHRATRARLVCQYESEFHVYAIVDNMKMLLVRPVFMPGEILVDIVMLQHGMLIWYFSICACTCT